MTALDLGFQHAFVPAGDSHDGRTLLLLHGTGGDEHDLIPLGRELAPGAALLSPRGKSLEEGSARFFRRLAPGVFDEVDLIARSNELADFVERAAAAYRLDPTRVTAVGYSNGANIAAAVMLRRPTVLAEAVFLRAQVPLVPSERLDLTGKRVLLLSGRHDPIVTVEQAEALAELLRQAGATVSQIWQPGGHGLTPADVADAKHWLAERPQSSRHGGDLVNP